VLAGCTDADLADLDDACDASGWVGLLDEVLPRNYAVVLARGFQARRRLGLDLDEGRWSDLIERARRLFGSAEICGFVDDSNDGEGRFDIYSADLHLFAEPLADELGEVWRDGLENVIGLVERVGASNGAAFTWGRSTGVLSICMTIELGSMALSLGMGDDPSSWATRVDGALAHLGSWFRDGVVRAHQHRSPYAYRGPARRLQLTFDVLGKTAASALTLGSTEPADRRGTSSAAMVVADPEHIDVVVPFRRDERAAVWAYRSDKLAFVVPFTGTVRSDYLPAPQRPGLFEVPVDSPLATGVPTVWYRGDRYSAAGLPTRVVHEAEGGVGASWSRDAFLATDKPGSVFAGSRDVRFSVDGRRFVVDEHLEFEHEPHAVSVMVAERAGRPLHVTVEADSPATVDTIDVDGMKDHRSFWGELPRLHQIELEPGSTIEFRWSVRPKLRVVSTAYGTPYHDCIYRYLVDDIDARRMPFHLLRDRRRLTDALVDVDLFHVHWPEWVTGIEPELTDSLIGALADADVRIVWTMHNLRAHSQTGSEPLYESWASAADLVLHHSTWGESEAMRRYRFRTDARQVVLPHLHWGEAVDEAGIPDRAGSEREMSLEPAGPEHGVMRLGVVGAPRAEKQVQQVLDAFAATDRPDLRLFVSSLSGEVVPDDERITARTYEFQSPRDYFTQLRCLDALVMPFLPEGMLTTGTVGDAIALGLPALVSDWPFLEESLGGAGLGYDGTTRGLQELLARLDEQMLTGAAAARDLREATAPATIAGALLEALDELGTSKL